MAKSGGGQYVSGATAQNLLPGDLLVLNTTSGGKIGGANEEMIFWGFSVCFEHLFPLFAVGEISLLKDTTENLKGPKLYPASSSLARECQQLLEAAPPQSNLNHRSQVLRVAAAVLAAEFKNARSQRAGFVRIEDHMRQVFEGLSATELLTLSVGDMAQKFGCSRRHLNRLFHQHFGFSVASLRMELRLLKAVSLLRNPNVKIINVAEQCGFNHLGLFNTCFKRRFGNSPGKWRNTSGQNQGQSLVSFTGGLSCMSTAKNMMPAPGIEEISGPIRAKV